MLKRLILLQIILLISNNLFSQVSDYGESPVTMNETWNIDGVDYTIMQTVITGNRLYTIHVVVDHVPIMDEINKNIAKEIVTYAIEEGYLNNALKFNPYSDQFNIFDTIVGVALIHIDDPETNTMSGSRFVIDRSELGDLKIKDIELPKSFTNANKKSLISKIESIIESRYFEDLLDLYSPNALNDFDVKVSKLNTTKNFSLAATMKIKDNNFIVYQGQKSGIKGYFFYLPIEIVPVVDNEKLFNAYIVIQIIDEKPIYGIYNITLNFVDINDWNYMVQVGDISIPIKQR